MVVTQSRVDDILKRIDKNSTFGAIDPVEVSTGKPLNTDPFTVMFTPGHSGGDKHITIKRAMSRNSTNSQEFKLQMNLDHYKIKDGDDEKRKQ